MPYADKLLAQGRAEARIEVVELFMGVGVTWDVIEAATGLTEAGLQSLKTQVVLNKPKSWGGHWINEELLKVEENLVAMGRIKGRIEVVEDFRRAGVTWDVIDAATGLVEAGFELLKAESSERADSLLGGPP